MVLNLVKRELLCSQILIANLFVAALLSSLRRQYLYGLDPQFFQFESQIGKSHVFALLLFLDLHIILSPYSYCNSAASFDCCDKMVHEIHSA